MKSSALAWRPVSQIIFTRLLPNIHFVRCRLALACRARI